MMNVVPDEVIHAAEEAVKPYMDLSFYTLKGTVTRTFLFKESNNSLLVDGSAYTYNKRWCGWRIPSEFERIYFAYSDWDVQVSVVYGSVCYILLFVYMIFGCKR